MRRIRFCEISTSDYLNHDIDITTESRSKRDENAQVDQTTRLIEPRISPDEIKTRLMGGQEEMLLPRKQTANKSLRVASTGLLEQML